MKAKIKIFTKVINEHASVNKTWLSPYYGYTCVLFKYASGKMNILVNGILHKNVHGTYISQYNDWEYKITDLLDPITH